MPAEPEKRPNNFIRFSGMAFQMAVIMGGSIWLGRYLDSKLELERPLFTLVLAIFGVVVAIYSVIKDLSR